MATITENKMNNQQNIDQILSNLGNIGRYQFQIYFLSILPVFIAGMLSTSFVFTTAIPEHRCFVPICDRLDSIEIPHSKIQLFNRSFHSFTTPMRNPSQFDSCHVFVVKKSPNLLMNISCSERMFDNQTLNTCDSYVYNHEYFNSTIVSEFTLYCDKEWIVQILQSIFFFGVLVGAIFNGILADNYGRKIIFQIYSPVTGISILISIFTPNLTIYALGLFVKGMCVAGIYQSAFTLGVECLGGKWRFWLGNSYSVIFAAGGIYACLMAWWFRSWKEIEAANIIPTIFMLLYPFVSFESIRWQFSAGQSTQALIQISNAAKKNDVEIPDEIIESFFIQSNQSGNVDKTDVSIKDLFTHKLIRKWTITFLFIWFTNALVYYGLAFLASDINQNIYLSMVLLMAVEFPGVFLVSYSGEFSRKYVLMGIMILGGCSCIVCSFVPSGQLKMWLAILGKMSISGSFSLIYVYAAEIFPTILRITGLGMCSFCSRFGAMTAPYLLRLHLFGDSFPFLVIGIITLFAGLISIILPETRDKKLPNSLEEVEQLKYSKSQSYKSLSQTKSYNNCDSDDAN